MLSYLWLCCLVLCAVHMIHTLRYSKQMKGEGLKALKKRLVNWIIVDMACVMMCIALSFHYFMKPGRISIFLLIAIFIYFFLLITFVFATIRAWGEYEEARPES